MPRHEKSPEIIGISRLCGGEGGIRTHVPLPTNAFRVRRVMTTSLPLRINDQWIITNPGFLNNDGFGAVSVIREVPFDQHVIEFVSAH